MINTGLPRSYNIELRQRPGPSGLCGRQAGTCVIVCGTDEISPRAIVRRASHRNRQVVMQLLSWPCPTISSQTTRSARRQSSEVIVLLLPPSLSGAPLSSLRTTLPSGTFGSRDLAAIRLDLWRTWSLRSCLAVNSWCAPIAVIQATLAFGSWELASSRIGFWCTWRLR